MTEKWKLAFAQEAFKSFINELSAFKARNVKLGERDTAVRPFHPVSRAVMLDRFLATRIDLEPFRSQFGEVYSEVDEFCVDTSRWDSLAHA